jgi:protein phosphatase
VRAAFLTHRGAVRLENQDAVFALGKKRTGDMETFEVADSTEYPALLVVVDGMGGYKGGALAASLAIEIFAQAALGAFGQKFDPAGDRAALEKLLEKASQKMAQEAEKNPALNDMGATLAGIIARERGTVAFNCGDCRAYRITGGEIERLTKDHSVVQTLYESGSITEDEMRAHPRKNIVTSAVTAKTSETPELFVRAVSRVEEDSYFVCSDGVWETIPTGALTCLLQGPYPESAAEIKQTLLGAPCRDNISFIWAKSLP